MVLIFLVNAYRLTMMFCASTKY
uniref:Uncharacterized protein n=1 Tax=Arundo donax TaxID=35708 RepID=A0A0A9HJK7_ARUDO